MKETKCLAVFGGGELQRSLIEQSMKMGIKTLVLDPDKLAPMGKFCSAFEVISGSDSEGTRNALQKHKVDGIITTSTDKPLVMMAEMAEEFEYPFISKETARDSTDKFNMKVRFREAGIPCASGYLIESASDIQSFPVILKPLDNSGSRGVGYCKDETSANEAIAQSFEHTKCDKILCEEYLSGPEFSIESVHRDGIHTVVQITEKIVSPKPYAVEMAHIAPARISEEERSAIEQLIEQIGKAFDYRFCAAHTEIKIHRGNLFVIETSPRLGGDYINSKLLPLATGWNIEEYCIQMALGVTKRIEPTFRNYAGIFYLDFPSGKVRHIGNFLNICEIPGVVDVQIGLKEGDQIPEIRNSLDRYGHFIVEAPNMDSLMKLKNDLHSHIMQKVILDAHA